MKHILLSYLLLFSFAAHAVSMQADEVPDDSIPAVRLLAIGNSFSADAVEHYLQGIAKASNINLIIGHAFNGGYNLSSIWRDINNPKEDSKLQYYRKIDEDGHMTTYKDYTLHDAIDDEQWDYITLQQASGESGLYHTYEPFLENIITYFKARFADTNLKMGFHMVWPYANSCTLTKFKYYNYDQATMYNAILDATWQTMQNHPELDFLIPCGTAVQNLRSTFIGDDIDRDGYHLNVGIGRYTAAYTWFATLFQDKVASDTHFPYTLNAFTSQIAKNAATAAIANPYSVTPQIYQDYIGENTITPADIYINFSHLGTNTPQWNDITREYDMTTGLIDSEGKDAGIIVFQTEKFCNASFGGPLVTHTELNMPEDVSKTSVTGYSEGTNGNTAPKPSCAFSFQHMNKALAYDFAVFSSCIYTPGNRETSVQLAGADTITASINTTNNTSQLLIFYDVCPDSDGTVTLSVSAGSNNDTANKFYYLNALRISAHNPEDGLRDPDMSAYIHARKVFKDKHLYIIRDGETYSVDGKRIK